MARKQAAQGLAIALSAVLIIGLLVGSYASTLLVVGAIVLGLLVVIAAPAIIAVVQAKRVDAGSKPITLRGSNLIRWLVLLILVYLAYYATTQNIFFYHSPFEPSCSVGTTQQAVKVTEYHAIIEPLDFPKGEFWVSERVKYNVYAKTCEADETLHTSLLEEGQEAVLPKRQIQSSGGGIFIQELSIVPLEGLQTPVTDCCSNSATVELRDVPRDSFYEARDAQGTQISHYLAMETVNWSMPYPDTSRGIRFAYISPPYYQWRPILEGVLGMRSLGKGILWLLGFVLSAVVTNIIKPAFLDIAKDRFKSWLEKVVQKRLQRKQDSSTPAQSKKRGHK